MKELLFDYYNWIKAFHLIAIITWMAGLFYLPRLFVYHSQVKIKSESSELFKTMEKKLLRIIMNPAMILTWLLGGMLLWANSDLMTEGWMHIKLTVVVLLTGFHHFLVRWMKQFHQDERPHDEKTFRLVNEIPTVLLVVIVIMVIVKPTFS